MSDLKLKNLSCTKYASCASSILFRVYRKLWQKYGAVDVYTGAKKRKKKLYAICYGSSLFLANTFASIFLLPVLLTRERERAINCYNEKWPNLGIESKLKFRWSSIGCRERVTARIPVNALGVKEKARDRGGARYSGYAILLLVLWQQTKYQSRKKSSSSSRSICPSARTGKTQPGARANNDGVPVLFSQ